MAGILRRRHCRGGPHRARGFLTQKAGCLVAESERTTSADSQLQRRLLMRNKLTSKSIISAVAAACLLFVAAPAFALSVTGYSGKPQFPSNSSCMVEASAAVFNNCGAQVNWEIPMSVNPG